MDFGDGDDDLPLAAEGSQPVESSHAEALPPETKIPAEVMRPRRVEAALKSARTFEEYRKNRPFKFLHVYSGPNDPLGQAIADGSHPQQAGDGDPEPRQPKRP